MNRRKFVKNLLIGLVGLFGIKPAKATYNKYPELKILGPYQNHKVEYWIENCTIGTKLTINYEYGSQLFYSQDILWDMISLANVSFEELNKNMNDLGITWNNILFKLHTINFSGKPDKSN